MPTKTTAAVVHLELHTGDSAQARETYDALLGWRTHRIDSSAGPYLALELGGDIGGGIVECSTRRPVWLPYVEVDDVSQATDRARNLGGAVLLEPREGPAGWRSVVATPAGAELAFWQPKPPGVVTARRRDPS